MASDQHWFELDLLPGQGELGDPSWQIAWRVAYAGKDVHCGSALFRRSTAEAATLYFSPQARELANVFGARRCSAPAPDQLYLIAGDASAWHLHFRDTPARVLVPAQPSNARLPGDEAYANTVPGSGTLPPGFETKRLFAPTQPLQGPSAQIA